MDVSAAVVTLFLVMDPLGNIPMFLSVLKTVHPARRTPWVSIAFTSVIAIILVGTADISLLGGTTALLLLAVFTIVNIAVLVLRRDPVDHQHFRAPKWTPWVGIVTCGFLATPLSGRPVQQFLVAGVLLAVGAVLWLVNRWYVGSVEVDARRLGKG